jgi:predicted nucleic acid-binding protein
MCAIVRNNSFGILILRRFSIKYPNQLLFAILEIKAMKVIGSAAEVFPKLEPPNWLEILVPTVVVDAKLVKLDAGEREAIALTEELSADQLIVDGLLGRREVERRSLPVIGTVGVLREAAEMGLAYFK